MNSEELAKYIEATNGISKPWLLLQLRMKKLQERKAQLTSAEYIRELEELHEDMMKMGQWWHGIEKEAFGEK